MAQYLALATSVVSIILPKGKQKESPTQKTEHAVPYTAFSVGVVAGFSLATYIIIEIKYHRIRERIRYAIWVWLKSTDEQKDNEDESTSEEQTIVPSDHLLERPISLKHIESRCIGESSLLQVLVSPNDGFLTSSLHSVRITLKSGKCMVPMKAKGVELYYILAGAGHLSRDGDEGSRMVVGDAIAVNPWTLRFMSNQNLEDLVFLRVSDSGNGHNDDDYDIVGSIVGDKHYFTKLLRNGYDKISGRRKKLLKYFSSINT